MDVDVDMETRPVNISYAYINNNNSSENNIPPQSYSVVNEKSVRSKTVCKAST